MRLLPLILILPFLGCAGSTAGQVGEEVCSELPIVRVVTLIGCGRASSIKDIAACKAGAQAAYYTGLATCIGTGHTSPETL